MNPITDDNFASLFNCTPVDHTFRLSDGSNIKPSELSKLVGAGLRLVCFSVIRGSTDGFLLLWDFRGVVSQPRDLRVTQYFVFVETSSLTHPKPYSCFVFPMLIH